MNYNSKLLFVLSFAILFCGSLSGCYQRKVAASYQAESEEVLKIREQLGVMTPDRNFTNLEEEEDE